MQPTLAAAVCTPEKVIAAAPCAAAPCAAAPCAKVEDDQCSQPSVASAAVGEARVAGQQQHVEGGGSGERAQQQLVGGSNGNEQQELVSGSDEHRELVGGTEAQRAGGSAQAKVEDDQRSQASVASAATLQLGGEAQVEENTLLTQPDMQLADMLGCTALVPWAINTGEAKNEEDRHDDTSALVLMQPDIVALVSTQPDLADLTDTEGEQDPMLADMLDLVDIGATIGRAPASIDKVTRFCIFCIFGFDFLIF